VTKTVKGGSKKLVVCRMQKSVSCGKEQLGGKRESAAELVSELKESSNTEVVERCQQEKQAECAAVLPFSTSKQTQDAHTIVIEASLKTAGSAPGCADLGGPPELHQVCESSLLLF